MEKNVARLHQMQRELLVKNYYRGSYLLIALTALATVGCTSGSSSAGLPVSGSISTVATTSSSIEDTFSVDLSTYSVACATTVPPVTTGKGTVHSDGTFSLNIPGGLNQPLSCVLLDADGNKAADFLINDSSNKDLNGNNATSTTATFTGSAALGNISFDPNAGEVTVPATNIASSVSTTVPSAANVVDLTGTWTIGDVDFTLPSGIKGPCAARGRGADNCNGPPSGQSIYLKMWKGVKTSDNSPVVGLQVWNSPGQFTSCGSKIGLTPAIKTQLGIDFSSNGSSDAVFGFSTSVANFSDSITSSTGTVNLTNNWKMSTATLQHDIQTGCGPRDITAGSTTYQNAWVCGPDDNSLYQAQLGGGCKKNSDNTNVNLRDWSGIICGSVTTDSNGVQSNTCTGSPTIDSVVTPVTCSNKWAVTNASYVVQSSGNFNWAGMTGNISASGNPLCSSLNSGTEAEKIGQLRCYAEYFDQSGMRDASNVCLPKIDLDWTATTAANFEHVDLIRPEGLVFFERFKPYPDGSGGSMLTRQEHYEGVQVDQSWVNCRVIETGGLTIKKITDTKSLAIYQSATITTSTSKPACLGKFNGARETFMFYLTKN
jgi:hypothetical protein